MFYLYLYLKKIFRTMTELQKIFCSNLKRIRSIKNISQSELAKKAGMMQTTYSRLENGKVDPRISTIEKIAISLSVNASELFIDESSSDITLKEKFTLVETLNEYDQKLLEALIDSFIEKRQLEDKMNVKMKKRLEELGNIRQR